jgi:hypothetical protein
MSKQFQYFWLCSKTVFKDDQTFPKNVPVFNNSETVRSERVRVDIGKSQKLIVSREELERGANVKI